MLLDELLLDEAVGAGVAVATGDAVLCVLDDDVLAGLGTAVDVEAVDAEEDAVDATADDDAPAWVASAAMASAATAATPPAATELTSRRRRRSARSRRVGWASDVFGFMIITPGSWRSLFMQHQHRVRGSELPGRLLRVRCELRARALQPEREQRAAVHRALRVRTQRGRDGASRDDRVSPIVKADHLGEHAGADSVAVAPDPVDAEHVTRAHAALRSARAAAPEQRCSRVCSVNSAANTLSADATSAAAPSG